LAPLPCIRGWDIFDKARRWVVRVGYGTTLDNIGARVPRVDFFQSQGPLSEAWGKALMSRRCGVGRSVPLLAKRARQLKGLFKQGSPG
jgi:hypothetical protein